MNRYGITLRPLRADSRSHIKFISDDRNDDSTVLDVLHVLRFFLPCGARRPESTEVDVDPAFERLLLECVPAALTNPFRL